MKSNSYQQSDETNIALLQKDIQYIKQTVDNIQAEIASQYVTRIEFEPIKKIVYGLIALVLTMFMGAVISLVVRRP